MTKILVTGDSFAAGEWSRKNHEQKITHGGLAEYLSQDGYDVKHLPFPGNGNFSIINQIKTHLSDVNLIIFFWSASMRDIHYRTDIGLHHFRDLKINKNQLLNFRDLFHHQSFKDLNRLCEKRKTHCILIGGVEDLPSWFVKTEWINPLVPSFMDIAYPDGVRIKPMLRDWIGGMDGLVDFELFDEDLYNDIEISQDYWEGMVKYQPDTHDPHPNRRAHKKLHEYIQGEVKEHGQIL